MEAADWGRNRERGVGCGGGLLSSPMVWGVDWTTHGFFEKQHSNEKAAGEMVDFLALEAGGRWAGLSRAAGRVRCSCCGEELVPS